jgi:hypothetical protein
MMRALETPTLNFISRKLDAPSNGNHLPLFLVRSRCFTVRGKHPVLSFHLVFGFGRNSLQNTNPVAPPLLAHSKALAHPENQDNFRQPTLGTSRSLPPPFPGPQPAGPTARASPPVARTNYLEAKSAASYDNDNGV